MPYQTDIDTEDDDINLSSLPQRSQLTRKRTQPKRLGVSGKDKHDLEGISSAEGEDFSGSDGESDYIPPSKKQKAELILDHDLSHSETENLHGVESHDRQSNASEKDSVECDFNSEFDELTQKSLENSDVLANQIDKNHEPAHHGDKECVNLYDSVSTNLNNLTPLFQSHVPTCNCNALDEKMDMMNRKLNEILARYSILEKFIIKDANASALTEDSKLVCNQTDPKIENFIESNSLPIKTNETLKEFHAKLAGEIFRTTAVCILIIHVWILFCACAQLIVT